MPRQSLNSRHWPSWLERNKFFRYLFITRKLYLSKTHFLHFGQFGEDLSIGHLFGAETSGFYVDVGCYHPVKHSNTYGLYRRGWRGINVDVDTIKIDLFQRARPDDINVASAIGDRSGTTTYYSNGVYSLTTTLSRDFSETRTGYKPRETPVDTLDNVIGETKYKFHSIDFLSVDVEGCDLEVLKSLNFEIYRPRLIAVESHERFFSKVVSSDLYRFLDHKGYCLVGWCGLTLLMASKDFQAQLKRREDR